MRDLFGSLFDRHGALAVGVFLLNVTMLGIVLLLGKRLDRLRLVHYPKVPAWLRIARLAIAAGCVLVLTGTLYVVTFHWGE